MRVLAVTESPPTTDPRWGNGSTLIAAEVLRHLPPGIDVELAWFADRPRAPDRDVVDRCVAMHRLDVRNELFGWAAAPFAALPRASWLRASPSARTAVAALAATADVVYLHGLHAFAALPDVAAPVVANEIDPWSIHWRTRPAKAGGAIRLAARRYDASQAARAGRLEARTAARAAAYVVVSEDDARRLSAQLDREVVAIPNGVDVDRFAPDGTEADPAAVAFVGSLNYPPNLRAVKLLALEVLPRVRARRPDVRLVVAGRRPTDEVRALASDGVEVLADVADVAAVYRRAAVVAYPDDGGQGRKNTVLEALACGRAVVAAPSAARGLPDGPHIRVARGADDMARTIVRLLEDRSERRRIEEHARAFAVASASWQATARRYADVWESVVRSTARRPG